MYDDLILKLRNAAKMSDALAVLLPHSEGGATALLYNEAADAIEEMSKLADAIPHVCECCVGCELEKKNGGCDNAFVLSPKRAMQYLIKPRVADVVPREQYTKLLQAAFAMHEWIFLNTDDEQEAYAECGLTDEMNALLGYGGIVTLTGGADHDD